MLFKHSVIYILAKIIPGIMAFAALSLYTHFLEPSEYGLYTLIISGTALLHNVIYNWLPAGTLRFWANEKYQSSTFTSTLAVSYIRISMVLLGIALIGILYFGVKSKPHGLSAAFYCFRHWPSTPSPKACFQPKLNHIIMLIYLSVIQFWHYY